MDTKSAHEHKDMKKEKTMKHDNSYRNLLIMAVLSFISMYILMYAMVNTFANVVNNLNQFYMAGLMAAPMIVIELILMKMMYADKRLNTIIIVATIVLAILFFAFIREQTAIGDIQFLRSMIPHHAGAILMCEQASITDPEIQDLCTGIIAGQQGEIDQMRAILERLQK